MAIDVSTFAATIPAGTYAVGDVVQMKNTAGPAVVRSGRGAAKLKRISSYYLTNVSGSAPFGWAVYIKNSDWVDPTENVAVPMNEPTAQDVRSGAIQSGHDCELTQNSSWEVWAVCKSGSTSTIDNSITCEIEVDYPEVAAVTDPTRATGIPCSIEHDAGTLIFNATGDGEVATWETFSVDLFKAGYEYALEKIELFAVGTVTGYVAISDAAGMGGLTRIIPIASSRANIRPFIEYASVLRKGPMDIKYKLFNVAGSASSGDVTLILDFVKRKV